MFPWKTKTYPVGKHISVINGSTDHILGSQHFEEKLQRRKFSLRPFLGFLYVFLCSTFILLASVIIKKLSYISTGQLSLVRNIGVTAACLPIAIYCVRNILGPRKQWAMLNIRSFLGSTALYLNLMAYRYLPLAVASIVMSSVPALVMVTARLYLKEPCGLIPSLAVVVTVGGVLLSIRLPEVLKDPSSITSADPNYFFGLGCAVSCILILSITLVSLRKMQDVHFSVILLYFGVLGTLENVILTYIFEDFVLPRCGWDAILVMLVGVFGFTGHCFLTLSLQTEEAGLVSVMKSSTDIVISLILQVIFFSAVPDFYNLGGAALVIFSVSVIGFRKWLLLLPSGHRLKKKLKLLML